MISSIRLRIANDSQEGTIWLLPHRHPKVDRAARRIHHYQLGALLRQHKIYPGRLVDQFRDLGHVLPENSHAQHHDHRHQNHELTETAMEKERGVLPDLVAQAVTAEGRTGKEAIAGVQVAAENLRVQRSSWKS